MQLQDKTALILGIGSEIGQNLALKLAAEGTNLFLQYRKNYPKNLAQKLKSYSIKFLFIQADFLQADNMQKLARQITEENQNLHLLINCIGDFTQRESEPVKPVVFRQIIDSNLQIAYEACYEFLPLLQKAGGGRILHFGYALASQLEGKPLIFPYHIAKLGLILLTKALAKQEINNKVLVNCLSPAIVENSLFWPADSRSVKQIISLDQVSEAALFLLQSDYLTGVNLELDAGWRGSL